MKISKKAITTLSFTVGACVFVSTALADMALGSGYDQLKASAKITAAQMEKGLNNYTIEALFTLKDNGQTMLQASTMNKIDVVNHAAENTVVTQNSIGETMTDYTYSDTKRMIWKNGTEDKYYETNYANGGRMNDKKFTNPFDQRGAPEIEKIVDTLVGNLKDYVQVEESPNGRVYSGNLSEVQVPAVVNAVSSFGIKKMIRDQGRTVNNMKLPDIYSDIFVKKISGTAVEDKAGLLENVTGDVTLSGKDKSGVVHEMMLNVVFKLSEIGTTKVNMPDMAGKNVEKVSQAGGLNSSFVGTYRNNIVMEKDGKFVKIGERTVDITSVQDGKVTGKYYEFVKPAFKADYPDPYNFTFEYTPSAEPISYFTYTNSKGEQEKGQLHPGGNGKIYLDLNIEILDKNSYRSNDKIKYFDGEFDRLFAE